MLLINTPSIPNKESIFDFTFFKNALTSSQSMVEKKLFPIGSFGTLIMF